MWAERLRGEPRFRAAVEELWPHALGLLGRSDRPALARARRPRRRSTPVERGAHTDELARALGGDDDGAAQRAGGRAVVTAEQVWAALDEIADPEIPVISLVDLGVIRDVAVDGGRVRVEFTPTFLGCPALEVMRDRDGRADRASSAPSRRSTWSSTTRGRPTGSRPRAARSCAQAGFAPPAPREAGGPQLVQLQASGFRCPYCGSTETRLENIFGPTPCRSLRYCNGCRQPFEQFKTI